MSNEAITAVSKSSIKPSGRKFVAMALADFADENWSCFPSVAQLAEYTAQGEKTVRDHLDGLEKDGIICRNRQRREDGTLGRYRFFIQRRNLPVANFARGEKQPEPAADFATHNPHIEPSSSLSETSSDTPSKAKKRKNYPEDFEAFWSEYPSDANMSKKEAHDAWRKLDAEDKAACRSAVPAFRAYCKARPDYRPIHACRFIAKRRFDGFAGSTSLEVTPKRDDERSTDDLRDTWRKRLDFARPRDRWITWQWGPPPGQSGCRVPGDMLTERDINRNWSEVREAEAA